MNDHPSSPIPDPEPGANRRGWDSDWPEPADRPQRPPAGLSDREAFEMLAESMADVSHDPDEVDIDQEDDVSPSEDAPTESQLPGLTSPVAFGRSPYDWSTPVLSANRTESVGTRANGSASNWDDIRVQARITEVIDLRDISPISDECHGSGGDHGAPGTGGDHDKGGEEEAIEPVEEMGQEPALEESLPDLTLLDDDVDWVGAGEARFLPPLVFLDTNGEILPKTGDAGSEADTTDAFERVVAGWELEDSSIECCDDVTKVRDWAEPMTDQEAVPDESTSEHEQLVDDEPLSEPIGEQDEQPTPDGSDGFDSMMVEPLPADEDDEPSADVTGDEPSDGFAVGMEPVDEVVLDAETVDDNGVAAGSAEANGVVEEGIVDGYRFGSHVDEHVVDQPFYKDVNSPVAPENTSHSPDQLVIPGVEPVAKVQPTIPAEWLDDPDLADLARVFDQYSGPVIAVIAGIVKNREAVDEALHQTFETAWRSADTLDPAQPRGPWLFTLARRAASEQLVAGTKSGNGASGKYPVPSHRGDPIADLDESWEAWEVRLAVDQLAHLEYKVLRLTHYQGLIHPEIASELHTTVGAVKSRSYSGSHKLVEFLDHVIRPDADGRPTEAQASALTWYLASVADGSDLDADERTAIKRVQAQLASPTAWIQPDPNARDRLVAAARRVSSIGGFARAGQADQTDPIGRTTVQWDRAHADRSPVADRVAKLSRNRRRSRRVDAPGEKSRRPYGLILIGAAVLAGAVLLMANLLDFSATDADQSTSNELQPSVGDADASAVLYMIPTESGAHYEFEFTGLDPTGEGEYYSAWLTTSASGPDPVSVPLGSFIWKADGDTISLTGVAPSGQLDLVVVTRHLVDEAATIEAPIVFSGGLG